MNPTHDRMLSHFDYAHLPEDLQRVSQPFNALARTIAESPAAEADPVETTVALRKLVEAKDCAVRAALALRGPH